MTETRKQNIAQDFIKENILNKVQWSFLWEINDLKKEIESLTNFDDILWTEGLFWNKKEETPKENKVIWLDSIMKILFNDKWKQRTKIWYETKKLMNYAYMIISDEWKEKLDLLYESLEKAKSEQELKQSLNLEFNQLQDNIPGDTNSNNSNNSNQSQENTSWNTNSNNSNESNQSQDNNSWNINSNEWNNVSILRDLTSKEIREMENLVEQSKNVNNINYLENSTYKKYLNIIERDLNLPKYTLECVCYQESMWKLYSNWHIIWSSAWAQGLFQFMPSTADGYIKNNKLKEKYWKTFTSKEEFLKDPLASAWAAWIMYSEFMNKYNYDLQSSLACYNWWIWNYQRKIWKRNLEEWDLEKLPKETKKYIENITKNLLEHNSVSTDNIFADLWKFTRNKENIDSNNMA